MRYPRQLKQNLTQFSRLDQWWQDSQRLVTAGVEAFTDAAASNGVALANLNGYFGIKTKEELGTEETDYTLQQRTTSPSLNLHRHASAPTQTSFVLEAVLHLSRVSTPKGRNNFVQRPTLGSL